MNRIFTSLLFFSTIVLHVAVASTHSFASQSAAPRIRVAAADSLISDTAAVDTLAADSLLDETLDTTPLPQRLKELLNNDIFQRTQVGLYVYDLTADTLVFAYHEKQCMRPASNEKLVTAITALHTLGTDYHYRTTLYADTAVVDSTLQGNLYIRAGYDPLIDAEDLRAFADSLKARGIYRIAGELRTDLSFKDNKRLGWGWCWDDDEVPLTPLLYRNRDTFNEAFRNALRHEGIEWGGSVAEGSVSAAAQNICTRTHTIDQLLLPMMKNSNNSMAESLFYQIAAKNNSQPATRKRAAQYVNTLISSLGLQPDHYQIADGSGLSLYNYLTPELLGQLLRYAYSDNAIYRHLLPSLPIAGEDGTLRKRMRGTSAKGNVKAKTGTVEGVSTLSGYCTARNGNTLCFSIMNNGLRYTSTGRNFQDRVCRALTR